MFWIVNLHLRGPIFSIDSIFRPAGTMALTNVLTEAKQPPLCVGIDQSKLQLPVDVVSIRIDIFAYEVHLG